MSSRVTRSSARQAAAAAAAAAETSRSKAAEQSATTAATPSQPASRKRKARGAADAHEDAPSTPKITPRRRTKRQKVDAAVPEQASIAPPEPAPSSVRVTRQAKARALSAMSTSVPEPGPPAENDTAASETTAKSRRKSGRTKKNAPESSLPATNGPVTRRLRKAIGRDSDVNMGDVAKRSGRLADDAEENHVDDDDDEQDGEGAIGRDFDDEDDDDDVDDPFTAGYLAGSSDRPSSIHNTLRALTGIMSGVSSRLRDILANLKQKNDPSVQLIALQELSEILLVSTEDNLSGHFSPDQFVKELVTLMEPNENGDENPEMMLLACRCIANLMEALPSSTANVVYGGAVPVLCQKLLEIHYIDLAEQALSTLEKISVEFPASIVREGGLTASLTYLDFFATSTQRTAVTTAANCCRNIPEDSFPVVRDVMPILLNVLGSSDQKVVEQACLCVCRVVESFRYRQDKLEELVSTDLLRAILRLLLPGTTNFIGPNIFTQFLRVLAITARASPKLSAELFKMDIVDTLYQILTGVSPPTGSEDIAKEIDSVVIMQALIHRPRDQVFETLNVICELLPGLPLQLTLSATGFPHMASLAAVASPPVATGNDSPPDQRITLLEGCKDELRRFAMILLPTLTDAYSSTVNLSVRQKVLNAQLKMLSNLDSSILEDALRSVPYASFLASILSQQDHPSLVLAALQAANLLIRRLEPIYRYQFYRQGVIAEIAKLADRPTSDKSISSSDTPEGKSKAPQGAEAIPASASKSADCHGSSDLVMDEALERITREMSDDDEDDDDVQDDMTASPSSSQESSPVRREDPVLSRIPDIEQIITSTAKKFILDHENEERGGEIRQKALKILGDLRTLSTDMEQHFLCDGPGDAVQLFAQMAVYFGGDALDSITSYEVLQSGIVRLLLDILSNPNERKRAEAQSAFLEVFMGAGDRNGARLSNTKSPSTPFGAVVHKLQDLLSRAEHFEVVTVHQNSLDSSRGGPASMLAKQLRLRLIADDDSGIPRPFRGIMVSIHAIATFKALDDYLRPRISMSERSKGGRHREGVSQALAAFAAAAGLPHQQRLMERAIPTTGSAPSTPQGSSSTSRVLRKSSKSKTATASPASQPTPSAAAEKPAAPRRSSRRHQPKVQPPPPAPQPEASSTRDALECADERRLVDDSSSVADTGALDAILDSLHDAMGEDTPPEPTAVNVEVASSGKITARKEDGSRVATPSHGPASSSQSAPSLPTMASDASSTPSLSTRHRSYAAAMQSVPQDWHIEFSIGDEPVANETTIYGAVHKIFSQPEDNSSRNIWSAVHSIKYKRVSGPPPPEPSTMTLTSSSDVGSTLDFPLSLDKNPVTSTILRLLNILHALNANVDDVLVENKAGVQLNAEPVAQFVNTKLTAKLNRQLEEPLIVASHCLPSWSEDLARLYPFLFPFETRHLFLQSTSFGYSRSMARWQTAQSTNDSRQDRHRDDRPFLGRLQRQKVRISRNRILESAVKVMELYGASPSVLEVEYFEEVGTGLGPTLEFYSTVSKEFSKKKLKLWRENESNNSDEYAFGKWGLFPAPMSDAQAETEQGKKVLQLFKVLGKFVARSMLDSRIIDISFNPTFFRIGDGSSTVSLSLGAVGAVDENLAKSLKLVKQFSKLKARIDDDANLTLAEKAEAASHVEVQGARLEDLGLDFTLPGYPSIELQPNGSNMTVNIDNVGLYVDRVIDLTLGKGVQRQVDAFRAGFSSVFAYSALKAFTPAELVMLFGRVEEDWSIETLMDSIKADHGFNMDSKSVKNLLQTMSELSPPDRRQFLQFVTGSPKLPIGGFKRLTPSFTVVCKPSEPPFTSDDYLPSVMTCVNYLKLPDYTNAEVMRERLNVAIKEGQGAFHLS